MNDMCQLILNRLFRHILSSAAGALTKDAVVAAIPVLLSGELCKYAETECAKTDSPIFLNPLTKFAATFHPDIAAESEEGLLAAAKLLEYAAAELLELAGNCSRDFRLECVHPFHIMNIEDNELEEALLNFSCMGNAANNNGPKCALYQHSAHTAPASIFSNDKENHEYFSLVNLMFLMRCLTVTGLTN